MTFVLIGLIIYSERLLLLRKFQIAALRKSTKSHCKLSIPGDPKREAEAIRSKEGIPLIKPVVDNLLDISPKTGIPFEVK